MLSRTRTIVACTAAAAAAGLAVSFAAPALASSLITRPHGQLRFAGSDPAAGLAAAAANSRSFAGYATAVPAGSATVLTASFTVPALSCTTVNRGIAPATAVPTGNTGDEAYVFTGCVNGAAVYYPGLGINGTDHEYQSTPFAAGDVIDLTTKVSTNRTRVQVTDVTSGVTQKIIGAGAKARAALVIDDGWISTISSPLWHVPSFGKLTFKSCLLDGKSLASWRPQAYNRVNSIGTLQISTGNFWPGGTAFTTHFVHS